MKRTYSGVLLIGLVFVSCSSVSPERSVGSLPLVKVKIEELAGAKLRATIRFHRSVEALSFTRTGYNVRHKFWKIKSKNLKWDKSGEHEVLRIASEHPKERADFVGPAAPAPSFSEVVFEISYHDVPTKFDYELFGRFSDKSFYIYSGHFHVTDLGVDPVVPIYEFEFVPYRKNHVVTVARTSDPGASQVWVDESGEGTFVYFGKLKTETLAGARLLIDPKLPAWIQKSYKDKLPEFYDLYAKETGFKLDFEPTIFFVYQNPDGRLVRRRGGTRPGMLQMTLVGSAWQKELKETRVELMKFLGHESAHFWNKRMFKPGDEPGKDSFWMHEGGAETFAYFGLLKTGIITTSDLIDQIDEHLNHCLEEVVGMPLNDAKKEKKTDLYYSCGFIIGVMVHFEIRRKDPATNVLKFWGEVFRQSEDRTYTQDTFTETLAKMTQSRDLSEFILQMAEFPNENPKESLRDALNSVGVKVSERTEVFPKSYEKRYGKQLLRELMKQDCGFVDLYYLGQGVYQLRGTDKCKTIKKPRNIVSVRGYPLRTQGAQAYDFARSECAERGYVKLQLDKGVLKLSCQTLPERPAPLGVDELPI